MKQAKERSKDRTNERSTGHPKDRSGTGGAATLDAAALKSEACAAVDRLARDLLRVSRDIHAHPELAFQEHHASALLAKTVREAGLAVETGAYELETAFAAEFGDAPDGPRVAILAEYDALPGIGHACGHNLIATSAVGAALALQSLGAKLPGRVRLLGTPAEERGGGKELMARKGAFEDVDAAMMMHPASINAVTMPSIAVADVTVVYHGRSAHASAMPHRGVNALDAVVSAYQAIAALRQHIRPTERIHGIITEGGQAPNIVPGRAAARFYVRASDFEALEPLKKRVLGCFEAGARATGAELDVQWSGVDYQEIRLNDALGSRFQANAESLGREFVPLESIPPNFAGSTDMGNVSHRVPSIHPMLAAAPPHCTIHHPEFAEHAGAEIGDAAALDGARALAMTALDFLCDADLRREARDEFERRARG